MKKILLSIKVPYIEKILNGSKRYEYRTRLCARPVDKIILYATTPIKAIVGEVDVQGVLSLAPGVLWSKTSDFAGIEYHDYKKYFHNRDIANAYVLGEVKKFEKYISLNELGIQSPPQSYMYFTDEKYDAMLEYRK